MAWLAFSLQECRVGVADASPTQASMDRLQAAFSRLAATTKWELDKFRGPQAFVCSIRTDLPTCAH